MSLGAIFSLMLSAVLIENYIFVRFLGICRFWVFLTGRELPPAWGVPSFSS